MANEGKPEGRPGRDPRRRQTREERDESFRLLVDAVQDYAIFRLDSDGYVQTWNAGAQRIKGYTADEIIGQHFSVFYPSEDLEWGKPEWELDVARREGRLEDEGWRIRRDGTTFWANVVITALYDKSGALRGFAKVTRDLTARREADQARTQFIANAAHELRTPLAVIVGLVSFLKQAGPITADDFTEHVEVLVRQADRMHDLVNNLLDLATLDQGPTHLPMKPVNVANAVARVLADVPSPLHKRVSTVVGNEVVLADEQRVEQIITNLLSNAYRHGGDVIVIAAHERGDHVEIEVADNGPGIEPALRPDIFEPFRRGSEPTAVQGSGLGLAIVKGLVEAYDGTISLDPNASGARFIVTFKRA